MSAIAAITVNDGQATPVAHVFNPVSTVPARFERNGDSAVPVIGWESIVASLKRAQNGDAINRVKLTLQVPVLETTSGSTYSGYEAPPKVAYFLQANVEVLLPNRSTAAQRKDLRVMLSNLLLDTQIEALIDSLETPY